MCFGFVKAQNSFNKREFYATMASYNLLTVEQQISKVKADTNRMNMRAYLGALQMKRAELLKEAAEKINTFKIGHKNLESVIARDSGNAEARFLRIMVQEHSPKMMNYHADLSKDAAYLRKNFKTLDADARRAVLDYSKTSKVINARELSGGLE